MTPGYRSRQGYLVLADISGYTVFLTGTELEHAQAIIYELTTLIRERLAPPLRFVKCEGDAVFCYADEAAFPDGERLIELLEACYFDFSNRLENMVRGTTCRCNACASIGSLGLKFIVHFGTYVLQPSGGGARSGVTYSQSTTEFRLAMVRSRLVSHGEATTGSETVPAPVGS